MTSQVLTDQSIAIRAFSALLHGHAAVTRQLNTLLSAEHGLTLSDYGVLLRLARAPGRRLRRVDLAVAVLLTASGITRLLDGLERSGLVERHACTSDRRVVYAVLTDAGLAKLHEAAESHVAQIEELFGAYFDPAEQQVLGELLARIDGVSPGTCRPPDA